MKLEARRRVGLGKGAGRRVRSRGLIPAVMYGAGGEAVSLAVEPRAIKQILASPMGINSIFTVEVAGGETVDLARIVEFQKHPLKRTLVHCDIQRLEPNKARTFKVPVALDGVAPAIKLGARTSVITRYVNVLCLPEDIPEAVRVDIGELMPGGSIRLADIELGDKLTLLYRDNAPVVLAGAIIVEEEEGEDEEAVEAAVEPADS